MPNSTQNVALYRKINEMVEDFLDNDLDESTAISSNVVFTLNDESGIKITIDISNFKQK